VTPRAARGRGLRGASGAGDSALALDAARAGVFPPVTTRADGRRRAEADTTSGAARDAAGAGEDRAGAGTRARAAREVTAAGPGASPRVRRGSPAVLLLRRRSSMGFVTGTSELLRRGLWPSGRLVPGDVDLAQVGVPGVVGQPLRGVLTRGCGVHARRLGLRM